MKVTYLSTPLLPPPRSGQQMRIREIHEGEIGYPAEYSSLEEANLAWEGREDGIWCIKNTQGYSRAAPYLSETWENAHNPRKYTHTRTVVIA